MTFNGNFMPRRFGAGKPQKPKVKTYRAKRNNYNSQVKLKEKK